MDVREDGEILKLLEYFALNAVTGMAMMVLSLIPLVTDLITASGYSSGEVLGGIFALVFMFYTILLIFTWRP
jgi:hypothetical protein